LAAFSAFFDFSALGAAGFFVFSRSCFYRETQA